MPNLKVITIIVTNYTNYLKQSIDSSICPFIVYDGIKSPSDKDIHSIECNFNNQSKAKNLALSQIKDFEFIQFLDAGDYLNNNYYEELEKCISKNNEFDFFYTDYKVINEDFDYQYREYLLSPSSSNIKETAPKIKNPLIRLSALKGKRFDGNLVCYEMVDMIYQLGIKKMLHIPESLQHTRIHSKCRDRITSNKYKLNDIKIIDGRLHGKI